MATVGAAGFAAGVVVLGARKLAMQGMTAIAGDWFRQLKVEHKLAEALFETGLRTKTHETGKRTAILAHLAYALLKHGLQEETVIYPALRAVDEGEAAKALAAEHFDIKSYLHNLAEMPKDDPMWIQLWGSFHKLVKHHVREEEEEIFPKFYKRMTPKQNRHLTAAMNREGVKLA
jgi:hemerythrin superfamily protein